MEEREGQVVEGDMLAWHHPPDPIGTSVLTVYLVLTSHIVNP